MVPNYSTNFFDDSDDELRRPSAEDVLVALLKHNFLPNQKEHNEDLPPTINSESFTPEVAKQLIDWQDSRNKSMGYDSVEYKLTRFNGVSRLCSIPHPKAYSKLVWCIYENWKELEYIVENKNSKIVPQKHSDGRLIIMDYENSVSRIDQLLDNIFGLRFVARTDIANFYPSVYTHSIPWAVVGLEEAKNNKKNKQAWYNQFDQAIQSIKRNETQGIAIGPATSNIIAEAILAKIDFVLSKEFIYTRYLDDYTAYCESHEQAQKFVLRLGEELAKYKLVLNIGKTEIESLPQPFISDWVIALKRILPKEDGIDSRTAIEFLDSSVRLAKESPDGSVLKYALRALMGIVKKSETDLFVKDRVLKYALNLSFYQPVLFPMLDQLIYDGYIPDAELFQKLTAEFARLRYSDILAWSLYFAGKLDVPIDEVTTDRILASGDCIPILMLYLSGTEKQKKGVIKFAKKLGKKDLYLVDQYWLLLYQRYCDGNISDPYGKNSSFSIMKSSGVTFVPSLKAPC